MYSDLEHMMKMQENAIKQLNNQFSIFTKQFEAGIQNLQGEEKETAQEAQAVITQAMALAKKGKAKESQQLLTDIMSKYGC